MSRRVVVLLVVLGITVPYCALGLGLWPSRGTGQTPTTETIVIRLDKVQMRHHHGQPIVCLNKCP